MSKVNPSYRAMWKRVNKADKPNLETILRAGFEAKETLNTISEQLNKGSIKCPDNNGVWLGKHVSMMSIVLGMRRAAAGRSVGKSSKRQPREAPSATGNQDTKALIDLVVHNEQMGKEVKLRVLAALLED